MKALYLHAVARAPHPRVLGALDGQLRESLRPFRRFVGQAIAAAKTRQTRYQLPWEPVRHLRTLGLTPMDSLLRIPRDEPSPVLAGWPGGTGFDLGQQAFIVNRSEPVRVLEAARGPRGLAVRTEPALRRGDQVIWCGITCPVELGPPAEPPSRILSPDGEVIELLGAPEEVDGGWLLRLSGRHPDGELLVDGASVPAQVMPDGNPGRLTDSAGALHSASGATSPQLRVEEPPPPGPLVAGDGRRWSWSEVRRTGRAGTWVQLLPPARADDDELQDPRAVFCEGDVREVWTKKWYDRASVIPVLAVDSERYQLRLARLPPPGASLFLPVDVYNLGLQLRALRQLAERPLPHLQGLLRICEHPGHVQWPDVTPEPLPEDAWIELTDPSRSGTEQQRRFVEKALATPDLALLEGPPGSGKTTAICELVQQLVKRGQRVLLCASTHVAIDNVLERLIDADAPIDAVRVGRAERVDDTVAEWRLDARVETLVGRWKQLPRFAQVGDAELEAMAERAVVGAANLTCGTTMGIVAHPLFRGADQDLRKNERPIANLAHWDVLIIDEASKTKVQEFLVPALMAKRWIIVGDVRQLPPFADRDDMVANLRALVDAGGQEVFPADHQRACLLLHRLLRPALRDSGARWLLVEPPGVLRHLVAELGEREGDAVSAVHVVARRSSDSAVPQVTLDELEAGAIDALRLVTVDLVLVPSDLFGRTAGRLPGDLLLSRALDELPPEREERLAQDAPFAFRRSWCLRNRPELEQGYRERRASLSTREEAERHEAGWLARNDLAKEITWRITRLHELKHGRSGRERRRLRRGLGRLLPRTVDLSEPLGEIEDIGLPSVLEVLQVGIGAERASRPSALNLGLRASRESDFGARFESLVFQHRMHPEIAAFPREVIYGGDALLDANTIARRDREARWMDAGLPGRQVWLDVDGREAGGVNRDEIGAIESRLLRFIELARLRGDAPRAGGLWEVACLAFYTAQVRAMSEMLQRVTGDRRKTRFRVRNAPVEVVCGTVDRFQGREADLVFLSMRNTHRTGFLDSPNRLNVAVTRARQQLVVVGAHRYFAGCGIGELEQLARRARRVRGDDGAERRRRK